MIVDNDPGQVETIKSALSHHEDFEILSVVTTRETAIKQIAMQPRHRDP